MFDAYKVAVRLTLVDGVSTPLRLLTSHFRQANQHVAELQSRLTNATKIMQLGAGMTAAGFGMAMVLKETTNQAVLLEQQMNKLKALNLDNRFGAGTTGGLVKLANNIAQGTYGTSQLTALRLATETQAITGDVRHTYELAPLLAKLRFGMETYMAGQGKGEGHGEQAERQFADIVKVMELRGLMRNFSASQMNTMADLFTKNYIASGGMVKPSDFLNLMKTAGVAGKSVDNNFLFALGHIMQEKGGSRSGTQVMSAYQSLVMGRTTQQVAENLAGLGLLNKASVHYGKTGHITKVDPGALIAAQTMIANPLTYLNQYILPALKAKGVDITNQGATLLEISKLSSNRMATDMLAGLYLERTQIANYMAQAQNAYGVNALYNQGGKSAIGMQTDLMAKVNQLELDFGKASLPLLKNLLEQAIPLAKAAGSWMDRHPTALVDIAKGLGLVAGALVISGPLTMLGGALKFVGAALQFSSIGGVAGIRGIAAAIAGGGGLTLVGGLAVLGATVYGLTKVLQEVGGDSDVDPANHPGQRFYRHGRGAGNGEWRTDPTLPQAHAGMHLVGYGRSAHWEKNTPEVVPPAKKTPVTIHVTTNLDGKKVAEVVTKHQDKAASRPNTAQAVFDGQMGLRPVGL